MSHRLSVVAFLIFALAVPSVHGAEHPAASSDKRLETGGGVRVYMDPQSKEIAEPAAEAVPASLRTGPRAPDFTRMREERLADGTVLLHPNGQVRTVSVVRRAADGSFASSCDLMPAVVDESR